MTYELGLRNDGWLVVDVPARRVAEFGGISLQGLSNDEAETMRGLLLHRDRALATFAGFTPPPDIAREPQDAPPEGRDGTVIPAIHRSGLRHSGQTVRRPVSAVRRVG